jgi:hypothetical protein
MVRDWLRSEREIRAAVAQGRRDPEINLYLSMALLGQGRWAEGFQLRSRWRAEPATAAAISNPFPYPRWQGEDLAGKDFLICTEEPFGDEIMWFRFARILADRGARVTWLTHPELVWLFRRCGGLEAFPLAGTLKLERFDFYCPSWDLPTLFFPPLTEPPGKPYLTLPPPNVIPGLRIGVVTSGNPKHINDAHRSLPEDLGQELLAMPGAVSLKPEDTGARDFYDTATVIAGLDLVISVDTSVAHLAGALGKPVWILLPAEGTDWRWELGRSDTPWYDSARLFRQPEPGDWRSVVEAVRAAASSL